MSINIGALKWQGEMPRGFVSQDFPSDSLLWDMTYLGQAKGKVSVPSINLHSKPKLIGLACNESDYSSIDGEVVQFPIAQFALKIPFKSCEINQTWIGGRLLKGSNAESMSPVLEDLMPILGQASITEIVEQLILAVILGASADLRVVTEAPATVTDNASAYLGLLTFIQNLPSAIKSEHFSRDNYNRYSILMNPEDIAAIRMHYETLGRDWYGDVAGFNLVGLDVFTSGNYMATPLSNLVYALDSESDFASFKIVKKEEVDKVFLIGGIGLGAGYIDPKRIVLTK